MCFNYQVSLLTFFIGMAGSYAVMYHGNPHYKKENIAMGFFSMFIASIQFMEFLFWIDIHNIYSINKITTILGPILNVLQPTFLYCIKYLVFKPHHINGPLFVLNAIYVLYFLIQYTSFLTSSSLVTGTLKNKLNWPWIKYFCPYCYLILFALNIFYLFDTYYATVVFVVTYSFLIVSALFFNYNIPELWCFFGAFIPFIIMWV